jgi:hypothetical protein
MTRILTTTTCLRSGLTSGRTCFDSSGIAAELLSLPGDEAHATRQLRVLKEARRNRANDGPADRMVINVSLLLLARLETRWLDKYNILCTYAKKAVAGGDVLFLPALNLLNLIGLIDYRPETDVVEYMDSGHAVKTSRAAVLARARPDPGAER